MIENAKVFVFRLCEIYDEHGATPVLGVDKMIALVAERDAAVRKATLEEAAADFEAVHNDPHSPLGPFSLGPSLLYGDAPRALRLRAAAASPTPAARRA